MGCYPLGKIVSKALGKCNGRDRWREERMDYAAAYPPGPPAETHHMRPVAGTVTFSGTNSVYVNSPEPPPQQGPEPQPQSQTPPQHEPDHHPPQPQPQPEPPPPAPAQSAPPAEPKQPKRGKNKQPGRVRFGPEPPPSQPQQQQHAPSPNDSSNAPGHGHGHGPAPAPQPQGYFRYTPSPLPRWEATPRRHEYFSGEYRYSYPTPVREGIYSIATDANRLTTIFSEENPNACAIV